MFISIPKEFFVPVVFGEGFTLNEENNNLELDLNMYRETISPLESSFAYKMKTDAIKLLGETTLYP